MSNEVSQLRASIALLKRENDELRLAAAAKVNATTSALALPPLTASALPAGGAEIALALPPLTLSPPLLSASVVAFDDDGANDVSMMGGGSGAGVADISFGMLLVHFGIYETVLG